MSVLQPEKVAISKSWLKRGFNKLLTKDNLKHELDALLMKWKPSNFSPMDRDIRLDPARVCTLLIDGCVMNLHETSASCLYQTRAQCFLGSCFTLR